MTPLERARMNKKDFSVLRYLEKVAKREEEKVEEENRFKECRYTALLCLEFISSEVGEELVWLRWLWSEVRAREEGIARLILRFVGGPRTLTTPDVLRGDI